MIIGYARLSKGEDDNNGMVDSEDEIPVRDDAVHETTGRAEIHAVVVLDDPEQGVRLGEVVNDDDESEQRQGNGRVTD